MSVKNQDSILRAAATTPHPRQLLWQQTEFYGAIYFGLPSYQNTQPETEVTGPALFEPKSLDTDQWAAHLQAAGMRAMVLCVKHHDGFCLWPSQHTTFSVKSSPWMDGAGDLVAQAAKSCQKYNLKFGIAFSVWDMQETQTGTQYNTYVVQQLTELCSNYGDIFYVYLDGAQGAMADPRRQDLDWQQYYDTIRQLQPDAAIGFWGPDVRWNGNDVGHCRTSEWSVVPYYYSAAERMATPPSKGTKLPKKISYTTPDIGSRSAIQDAGKLIWYPAEVRMPLRKRWFYHPKETYAVKDLVKLIDTYYQAVGGNACLCLGIAPDPDGNIPERESHILKTLGIQLRIDFNENLADDSTMTDNCRLDDAHCGQMALSHNPAEYWHSGMHPKNATLVLDLGDDYDIDKIVLGEHIQSGQQIEQFTLSAEINGKWKRLAKGSTIGYRRILRFPETRIQRFQLTITQTREFATISHFAAY